MFKLFKLIKYHNLLTLRRIPQFRFSFNNKNNKYDEKDPQPDQEDNKQLNNKILDSQSKKDSEDNHSTILILTGGFIFVTMTYILMQLQFVRSEKKVDKFKSRHVQSIGRADIGGQWQLLDTKGNKVSDKDFRGTYYLIYFGFCNCPDICPNSLMKLKKAVEKIKQQPQGKLFKLKTIFVSVDPDRDTPQKIDKFLSYFDKQFIGLTGKSNNDQALKQCLKKFKIYSTKIQYEQQQQETQISQKLKKTYTIDHTILTYLMDDQNNYLAHLGANLGDSELAKVIIQNIMKNQKSKY